MNDFSLRPFGKFCSVNETCFRPIPVYPNENEMENIQHRSSLVGQPRFRENEDAIDSSSLFYTFSNIYSEIMIMLQYFGWFRVISPKTIWPTDILADNIKKLDCLPTNEAIPNGVSSNCLLAKCLLVNCFSTK
jgi:hypothetical protein